MEIASRMLKKAKSRSHTRAAQKRVHVFAGAYRAATVREVVVGWPFPHPAS